MPEITVNLLAVVLAALASMAVGMLWYGPLFGKQWMKLMGLKKEDMKKMKLTPMQAMAGGLISAFVMAYVLAHDAFVWAQFAGDSVGEFGLAIQLAFWVWLGYVATTQLGGVLWENKSMKLFALNAANSLVSLIVMALVITYVV